MNKPLRLIVLLSLGLIVIGAAALSRPERLSAAVSGVMAAATQGETPAAGQKAKDFTLKDLEGHPVQLSELLKQSPVVLVELRGWPGYQCPLCTRQVGEFVGKAKEFDDAKAKVVLVYPGASEHLKEHASDFASGKGIPEGFTFLIDPDYSFTNSYGLRWDARGETAYPSTFVIDREGVVRFAKTSKVHGDRSTPAEVLAALKGR